MLLLSQHDSCWYKLSTSLYRHSKLKMESELNKASCTQKVDMKKGLLSGELGGDGSLFGCGGGDNDNGGSFDGNVKKKKGSHGGGGGSSSGGTRCCQAEKCTADLTEAKQYHRRHRVCELHAKAQSVMVAGSPQRFCQQCSRFHELSEFDDAKRSCRRRLAGHNERRRKSSIEFKGPGKELVCKGRFEGCHL